MADPTTRDETSTAPASAPESKLTELRDEIARLTHERNVLRRLYERKEEFRGQPQLIIFLDGLGAIHAELPPVNGQRRKLDLPQDFATRNPELLAELATQRQRQKQRNVSIAAPRIDASTAREQRIEAARAAHQREWQQRFDNATTEEQQLMLDKRAKAEERSQARQHALAREIWQQTAKDHGINLANHVIPKSRRPSKTIALSGGTTYNPRTERGGKKRQKHYDATLAINITL